MKKREMYIFMEEMEAIGDTWTLEEVERVYGNSTPAGRKGKAVTPYREHFVRDPYAFSKGTAAIAPYRAARFFLMKK